MELNSFWVLITCITIGIHKLENTYIPTEKHVFKQKDVSAIKSCT